MGMLTRNELRTRNKFARQTIKLYTHTQAYIWFSTASSTLLGKHDDLVLYFDVAVVTNGE